MPQEEITGRRVGPSNYSKWHRKALPNWCYVVNGDWFELRRKSIGGNLEIVAYIETIEVENPAEYTPLWPATKSLVLQMVQKIGIPVFVVWHNPKCTKFNVWRVSLEDKSMKKKRVMDENEYKSFIMSL